MTSTQIEAVLLGIFIAVVCNVAWELIGRRTRRDGRVHRYRGMRR